MNDIYAYGAKKIKNNDIDEMIKILSSNITNRVFSKDASYILRDGVLLEAYNGDESGWHKFDREKSTINGILHYYTGD